MKRISTGSPFEKTMGYSRAIVKGGWCFVSGVTGYDYTTMHMPESALDQATNCFLTIAAVLTEAGFTMEDVVRVQYTLTDVALVNDECHVRRHSPCRYNGDCRTDTSGNADRDRGYRLQGVKYGRLAKRRLRAVSALALLSVKMPLL
jgi:Endoribonuclease L-PSP